MRDSKLLNRSLRAKYKITVEDLGSSRDLRYRAFIEEFGKLACYGLGKTVDQAVKALTRDKSDFMRALYERGLEIPAPREDSYEYSGRFVLRITSRLHARLVQESSSRQQSLNTFIIEVLSSYLESAWPVEQHFTIPSVTFTSNAWSGISRSGRVPLGKLTDRHPKAA